MPIGTSDGQTYESELDQLLQVKDMPSREETNRQQRMKDLESTMPSYEPSNQDLLDAYDQREGSALALHPQVKDQNDPNNWGMDESMGRTGPAMVPLPTPKFHEVMGQLDELISPTPQKIQAGPSNKESFGQMSEEEYAKWKSAPPEDLKFKYRPDHKPRMNGFPDEDIPGTLDIPGNMPEGWLFHRRNPDIYKLDPDQYDIRTLPKSSPDSEDYLHIRKKGKPPEVADIPPNAQLTSAQLDENGNPTDIPQTITQKYGPSGFGEGYDNFVDALGKASESLNPSFIPTAEQFKNASWREKIGFVLGTSMMLMRPTPGGKPPTLADMEHGEFFTKGADRLDQMALEHYRKLDTPVAREEYSKMIKDKIATASEGGETSASDITNPTIRGMKEGSDWSEVITKPDGTRETVYDTGKLERLRNLLDNDLTFTEIGEKMGISRNSVNSMVRRLRQMDAAEGDISAQRILKKAEENKAERIGGIHSDKVPEIRDLLKDGESYASIARKLDIPAPSVRILVRNSSELSSLKQSNPTSNWRPSEDKILTEWYDNPDSDLFGTPAGLEHRSAKAIEKRIKVLGLGKEDVGAEPFVPKGAVSAPEKGSGSGGGEPPRVKTIVRVNKRITTPIQEPSSEPANDQPTSVIKQKLREELEKKGYQIDNPALDAAIEREWQRMVNKDKPGTFEHAEDVQARRRDLKLIDRMPNAIKRMLTPPEKPKK